MLERISRSDSRRFGSLAHALGLGPGELAIGVLVQLALAKLLLLALRWPPLEQNLKGLYPEDTSAYQS